MQLDRSQAWSFVLFFALLAKPPLLVPLPQLAIKNNSLYFSADTSGILVMKDEIR